MNDLEVKMLREEVSKLRKEMDYLYRFIGNFVDLTGKEIEKTKTDIITKYNPLFGETRKEEND